jgi:imidazolonepropionase-like amidohydrolase
MDLLLLDVSDYISLAYRLGPNPVRLVLKDGKAVVRDGRRVEAAR